MSHVRALGATDFQIAHATPARARPAPHAAVSLFAQPLIPMLTTVGVLVLVVVGITTARNTGFVAALWGANALAVGVWLRSGRGIGFDLSFGAMMAFAILAGEFLADAAPPLAVAITVAHVIEITLAVVLARRFAPTLNLASVKGACRFIASVAIVPPLVSGLVAAGILAALLGVAPLETLKPWWLGHALGLSVVAPFVLAFDRRQLTSMLNPMRVAETVLLFGLLIAVCAGAHFLLNAPVGFAFVPILILIAVRLRIAGVTAAIVVVAISAITSLLVGAGPWRFVIDHIGERATLLQLTIMFGYVPIMVIASLLEERDRLAERTRQAQVRAERASAAKSRLLANVAHEIKSPIGGVIGIGDLWSTGQLGPITETQGEMAAMLVKTARQVEALSHDLLDVARAESGAVKVELRPTDVPGLLEDVSRTAALRSEARTVAISVLCESDGLVALADSQRLTQVVDNLATNALKYASGGGVLTFRARRIYDGVRIEVIDRGPGLSHEKQAQLFEPFNRLGLERSTVEGHGIGLALAKRLVELQGGSIGVTSTPGEGATFWIELPAA